MKHYPRISKDCGAHVDVCSEVAPVVLYTVDQSEKVVNPNHSELKELDKPNQHPIEAIIGLRDELDELKNKEVILEETDPTVPDWAKNPNKPDYTAEEVGALPISTKLADLEQDDQHLTVSLSEKKQWNRGTGTGGGFSGDYNDLLNKPTIPTKLAELEEDNDHRTVTTAQIAKWNEEIVIPEGFSGDYNDLTNKPTIPGALADLTDDESHRVVTDE